MKKLLFSSAFAIAFFAISSCNQQSSSSSDKKAATEMSTIEKEDLTQLNMKVAGMTCEGCEKTIETGLELLDGIASAKASHIDSTVSIQIDDTKVDSANIADKIVELGYVIVN